MAAQLMAWKMASADEVLAKDMDVQTEQKLMVAWQLQDETRQDQTRQDQDRSAAKIGC